MDPGSAALTFSRMKTVTKSQEYPLKIKKKRFARNADMEESMEKDETH
jgi:hypothetical protein